MIGRMELPLFQLLSPWRFVECPGELIEEAPHKKAARAYDRCYEIAEGHCILTEWNGLLHCVIYQTPVEDEVVRASRNAMLFDHYGEGLDWRELVDNGFGKIYRRADMRRFALWSYYMDYNTFGTMEFNDVRG